MAKRITLSMDDETESLVYRELGERIAREGKLLTANDVINDIVKKSLRKEDNKTDEIRD